MTRILETEIQRLPSELLTDWLEEAGKAGKRVAECGRDQARGVCRELLDWKRAAPRRLLQDRRRGEGPLQREEWEQRLNWDAGGQPKQHASLNVSAGWEGVAAAAVRALLPSSSPSDSPGGCGLTGALGGIAWK